MEENKEKADWKEKHVRAESVLIKQAYASSARKELNTPQAYIFSLTDPRRPAIGLEASSDLLMRCSAPSYTVSSDTTGACKGSIRSRIRQLFWLNFAHEEVRGKAESTTKIAGQKHTAGNGAAASDFSASAM